MSKKDLTKSLLASLANQTRKEAPKRHTMAIDFSKSEEETLEESGLSATDPNSPLLQAIRLATGTAKRHAPSLAMTENPNQVDSFGGLTKTKHKLLPDFVLKQIRVQDHLVAAILRARAGHFTPFGEKRKDRFSTGFEIKIKPEFMKILTPEQYEKIVERMKRFEELLLNCGESAGLEQQDKTTFAQYLDTQVRNGITFGRFATEIIYDRESQPDKDGKYPFHRFRARDVGTIEPARRKTDKGGDNLRLAAIKLLESMTGERPNIDLDKLKSDEYAWYQKIDGINRRAFRHDEMVVFNLYESTDVEHNGYPVTPLDTVINSVATHISIDTYKRLYFQNGRAAKGMLVISSDEVDEQVLNGIKLQFNASISSLNNSWRTPIFGMGKEDTVQWVPFAGEGMQDRTFEFMSDQVARNIMSAFSMGPDELPGYGHLSRGTNSQTLSESSNEFSITASRDAGLKPLVVKFTTFLNQALFPLMDPLLSKICTIELAGLDAKTAEQESSQMQQDMPTHLTYDEVLRKVDKEPIGPMSGGGFPFNERIQLLQDKFSDVGDLKHRFFGDPAASVDPLLRYKRDPFWLQFAQLLAQASPNSLQALFAPRPHALEFMKMNIQDEFDSEES